MAHEVHCRTCKARDLAGVAAARERYNSQLPKDSIPLSDNRFIQHMVEEAAEQFAQEFAPDGGSNAAGKPPAPETLESRLAAGLAAALSAKKTQNECAAVVVLATPVPNVRGSGIAPIKWPERLRRG
jgi:hypothetical protein